MRWGLSFILVVGSLHALSLQEAEEIALSNNPQICAAEELLEMARQGRLEALSKWLPQLNVASGGFKTQKPLTSLQLTEPSAFLTNFSLTQNLFSPELYHRVKISSLTMEQFHKLVKAAKNDVLFQARTLYFLVALDHQRVKTAKEHIDLLNYLAERMEGKHKIGEATPYHVNQARVAVANVTEMYYQTQKMLRSHQDELAKALGYDPAQTPFIFTQEEIDVVQIPEIAEKIEAAQLVFQEEGILKSAFADIQSQILGRLFSKEEFAKWSVVTDQYRPDILLSQTYVKIADETVRLKQGEYWPTLSFLGGYGGGSTPYFFQPSTRLNNQEFQWAMGFSLNWNLFDGFGKTRRVQKAKAEARAVRFKAKQLFQTAHTEVRERLYRMEKALAQYLTSSANYKLAEQTLQQAKSQLDIGYITIYDYMVSVDGLIRAKTNFNEGRFELLSSYYALLHASGKES